jgi:hypothetical protein
MTLLWLDVDSNCRIHTVARFSLREKIRIKESSTTEAQGRCATQRESKGKKTKNK